MVGAEVQKWINSLEPGTPRYDQAAAAVTMGVSLYDAAERSGLLDDMSAAGRLEVYAIIDTLSTEQRHELLGALADALRHGRHINFAWYEGPGVALTAGVVEADAIADDSTTIVRITTPLPVGV